MPLRYAWTGREYDAETGWYYFRARYYDPQQRRFVQEDPIGYAGSSNVYAYVEGRPLAATDPTGLKVCEDWSRCGNPGGALYDPVSLADIRAGGALPAGLNGIGSDIADWFGEGPGYIAHQQARERIQERANRELYARGIGEIPPAVSLSVPGRTSQSVELAISVGMAAEPHIFGVAGYSQKLKDFAQGWTAVYVDYADTQWLKGIAYDPTPVPGPIEMLNSTNWKFLGEGIERATGKRYPVQGTIEVFHDYYAGIMVERLPGFDDGLTFGMAW